MAVRVTPPPVRRLARRRMRAGVTASAIVSSVVVLMAGASVARAVDPLVPANGKFTSGGHPALPFGGEIEYYRIDPANWGKVLDAAAANTDTIGTYVPWNWHARSENGPIDFTGTTDPRRNVVRFVEMAGERGLSVVLRPGPWLVNEWPDGGVPAWLTSEARAEDLRARKGSDGPDGIARAQADAVSLGTPMRYTSAVYRQAIDGWYAAFAKTFAPMQAPNGPVSAIQVDNETSWAVFAGDPFSYDYHPETVAEFRRRTGEASAPTAFPQGGDPTALRSVFRWERFRGEQVEEFLAFLADDLRGHGITVPITANAQSLSTTFDAGYRDLATKHDVVISNDVYAPAQIATSPALRDAAVRGSWQDQIVRAFRPDRPAPMAEMGLVSYRPSFSVFEPGEAGGTLTAAQALSLVDMNTRLHLAQGMAGIGYYMLAGRSDPPNRKEVGVRDPTHTLAYDALSDSVGKGTAIGADGSQRPHLALMGQLHDLVRTNLRAMTAGRTRLPVAVGWHAAGLYAPPTASSTGLMGDVAEYGVKGVPYAVLDPLRAAGFVPGVANLDHPTAAELDRHRVIVLPQTDYLNDKAQKALADWVNRGGVLLAFPRLPARDDELAPDTRLADALLPGLEYADDGIGPQVADTVAGSLPLFGDLTRFDVSQVRGARVIATVEGDALGVERTVGRGAVLLLGGRLAAAANATPQDLVTTGNEDPVDLDARVAPALGRLLARHDVLPPARAVADPAALETIVRSDGNSGVVFVNNYTDDPVSDGVVVVDPRDGRRRRLQGLLLPVRSGLVLPLERPLAKGARLVTATGELTGLKSNGRRVIAALRARDGQEHIRALLGLNDRWRVDGHVRTGFVSVQRGSGEQAVDIRRMSCRSRVGVRIGTDPSRATQRQLWLVGRGTRRRIGRDRSLSLRGLRAGRYRVVGKRTTIARLRLC